MAPPAPVIQASAGSVAVGQNLRVSCSAVGEQDVVVEFTWEYPGQSVKPQHLHAHILPANLLSLKRNANHSGSR